MYNLPEKRNEIYVGFYLGGRKLKKGILRFLSTKIVRIFTKSLVVFNNQKFRVSHTELIFPNDLSFSSDGFDGGVRYKKIDYKKHPERWLFLKFYDEWVYKDSYTKNDLLENCNKYIGAKYDYIGVITHFGLRFVKKENPNKWWCSEICSHILNFRNNKIAPATMFRIIYKRIKEYENI